MEGHILFGKCPFHWDEKDQRPHVTWRIFACRKFWIKIGILIMFLAIPGSLIVLRFFTNKLGLFDCFEDNVPISVIIIYCSSVILLGSLGSSCTLHTFRFTYYVSHILSFLRPTHNCESKLFV